MFFEHLDAYDLIPHPIKRCARRSLALALWLSILLHTVFIGGFMIHRLFRASPQTVPLTLYPVDLLDIIDPTNPVASEQGGGGGGEPPPDPGDALLNEIVPVPVAVGIPEPVPDAEMAEEHEIAPEEERELVRDRQINPSIDTDQAGSMGGAGAMGHGPGSGGGNGGDGPPGMWRYDTPPNPRRLITTVRPRKLRDFEGIVKFRLLIDELGQVIDAAIITSSGYKELDALAHEAICKSTFNPATLQGHPVKAWVTFGYGLRSHKGRI